MRILVIMIIGITFFNSVEARQKTIDECDKSPNCVSSFSDKYPAPVLSYNPKIDPMEGLLYAIQQEKRFEIKDSSASYVHVIFESRIFRFKDDFKALIIPAKHQIIFSSKSRIGYYDFGVNKRRVNRIIKSFQNWEIIQHI